MATPDTRSSLLVVKRFTYRGSDQLWSNRYHVTGPEAMTLTKFNVFADAVVADEASALSDNVEIVRVTWNDAATATTTNPHGLATFDKPVSVWGTVVEDNARQVPGDCAAFIRYKTDARSSTNHPVYLFNYYHGIRYSAAGDKDTLGGAWLTAMNEYGDDWLAGFSDGVDTRVRCGPHGAVAQLRTTSTKIGHRDFPK